MPDRLAAGCMMACADENDPDCRLRRSDPAEALPPRDECAADASFAAFRESFAAAFQRGDTAALLAMTAPDIEFYMGRGIDQSGLLQGMDARLAGAVQNVGRTRRDSAARPRARSGRASMPYMCARMPKDRDAVDAIPGKPQVNPRSGLSLDVKVLRLLDWDLGLCVDRLSAQRLQLPRAVQEARGQVVDDGVRSGRLKDQPPPADGTIRYFSPVFLAL